jgi:fructose-1,6-bisphosphatase/inositol monophosphatase family enzyme
MAKLTARKAGRCLKEKFESSSVLNLNKKGEINIVTPGDLEAQPMIVDMLNAAYPGDDKIAE